MVALQSWQPVQAWQEPVELGLKEFVGQETHMLFWISKPGLHEVQKPSVALQVKQVLLQFWQACEPSENVPLGQALQAVELGANPDAHSVHTPLVLLQTRQLESQAKHVEFSPGE